MTNIRLVLLTALATCAMVAGAVAQTAITTAVVLPSAGIKPAQHAKHRAPTLRVSPGPSRSTDETRNALIHGSAAQRQMESRDGELANPTRLNHSHDPFFSDW